MSKPVRCDKCGVADHRKNAVRPSSILTREETGEEREPLWLACRRCERLARALLRLTDAGYTLI